MNYKTSSGIGIDAVINSIQEDLYSELIERWVDDIDGYGRVLKTKDSDGNVKPEFPLDNREYGDPLFNDNKSGSFFFIDSDDSDTEDELVFTNETKVVFMVDLSKILKSDPLRPDEESRRDVVEFLRKINDERFEIKSVQKGVENVFRGFDTSKIPFSDISPNHVFAVVIDLRYYLTDKC